MLGVEQLNSYPPSKQPGIAYAHSLHQLHVPKGLYHTFHPQKTQGRLNVSLSLNFLCLEAVSSTFSNIKSSTDVPFKAIF